MPPKTRLPGVPADGKALCFATGGEKGVIRLWRLETGRCIYEPPKLGECMGMPLPCLFCFLVHKGGASTGAAKGWQLACALFGASAVLFMACMVVTRMPIAGGEEGLSAGGIVELALTPEGDLMSCTQVGSFMLFSLSLVLCWREMDLAAFKCVQLCS